jgi:iron(III) transport system substrate-binding protein
VPLKKIYKILKRRRTMSKKLRLISRALVIAFLFGVALTGCASKPATSSSATSNRLIVYGAVNESDLQLMQKQFKADTGIELQYLRFDAGTAAARVETEKTTPLGDVLIGGSIEYYGPLETDGLLVKYTSPNAKDIDAKYADPNGYYQGWYMGVISIIINSDRFTKEMVPKGVKEPTSWDDLTNPAYKGLLMQANPASAGGAFVFDMCQLFRLGDTAGWTYINAVAVNTHHFAAAAGDVINLVATGQFIAGVSWAHDSLTTQKQGYPLKIIIPQQTAYEIGGLALIKGAPDMANAKKFYDWILTQKTGAALSAESNRYSVRTDVASPTGMPKITDVNLVNYDRAKATAEKTDVVNKMTAIIAKHG